MICFKNRIYKIIKKIRRHLEKIAKKLNKNVVLSFGENCLADNILERNGLKSFSSPYSFGRSNIEYILAFEKKGFEDFLEFKYLVYDDLNDRKVARNKKYTDVENYYHKSCINGFEFTHHDVIGSEENRATIKKRCQRMRRIRNKNLIMLYHHRLCKETNEKKLISHLQELKELYSLRNNSVQVYLFYQVMIEHDDERKVEHVIDNGINVYRFYTLNEWAGDKEELLWARCDDDLIKNMIKDIYRGLV